jgi:hypothetical protein
MEFLILIWDLLHGSVHAQCFSFLLATHKKKSKNKNHCILFLSVLRHAEHPTAKEGPQPLTRATNPCLVFGSGCPSLSILTR